jgi:hypothetical protein
LGAGVGARRRRLAARGGASSDCQAGLVGQASGETAATPAAAPTATPAAAPAATPAAAPAGRDPFAKSEPAPAGSVQAPADGRREAELYGDRLDAIQSDVNELKEKIFRSKARLAVLRETVLAGAMAGGRVVLAHRNLMGSGFQLVKVAYFLDGAPLFVKRDEAGGLDQQDELVIYDGNLAPGPHVVGVELTYKGQGFGAFGYLRGYSFRASSSHTIEVGERGSIKVVSVGFERGNVTTEMGDRPAVDWQDLALDAAGKPTKAASPGKSVAAPEPGEAPRE